MMRIESDEHRSHSAPPLPEKASKIVNGALLEHLKKESLALSAKPLHYFECIEFLEQLDASVQKLGLERVRKILETMGNPQDTLPMVHITGTNGKGSVSAMTNSILMSAGLRVGMFTSPHLVDVRERIVLNGQFIPEDAFANVCHQLRQHLESIDIPRDHWPTYFEWLNIQAYQYFQQQEADITVFEVGLGGRLDSTNVVKSPKVTVITSIGLDHAHILGDTVEKIAAEKAGILKPNVPLILGSSIEDSAKKIILERANALNIPVNQASIQPFDILPESSLAKGLHVLDKQRNLQYQLALRAPYQLENVATALSVIDSLREQGWSISDQAIQHGLSQVQWPARFQVLPEHRLIVDGSHNEQGFQSLQDAISFYLADTPIIWLCSLQKNRSLSPLLQTIAKAKQTQAVFWTHPQDGASRFHCPDEAKTHCESLLNSNSANPAVKVQAIPDLSTAFTTFKNKLNETPNAYGLVTGSLYTAGDTLALLLGQ